MEHFNNASIHLDDDDIREALMQYTLSKFPQYSASGYTITPTLRWNGEEYGCTAKIYIDFNMSLKSEKPSNEPTPTTSDIKYRLLGLSFDTVADSFDDVITKLKMLDDRELYNTEVFLIHFVNGREVRREKIKYSGTFWRFEKKQHLTSSR